MKPAAPIALLLAATAIAAAPAAQAIEEPAFSVVQTQGDIQIRDYGPAVAAETDVAGERGAAVNAGFRILAKYIFGGNAGRKSIAMTAPVAQTSVIEGQMKTAPLQARGGDGRWVVRFTMPRRWTLETLPKPEDPRVRLAAVAPQREAVIKFSGLTQETDIARQTARLEQFLKEKGLRAAGPATVARYDPPWIPGFARRNEIWIPIAN